MNNILIAALIGLAAGLVDALPMVLQKMDKVSCISAFIHYFVLGLIIPFVNWNMDPWLKGVVVSLLLALPVMVIVYPKEKKAIIPMLLFAIVLGAAIGIAGARFIG